MRLVAMAPLAVPVSEAGGLGFIAAGTDLVHLNNQLHDATRLLQQSNTLSMTDGVLPVGVGLINWGVSLDVALEALREHIPCAVWFFAPENTKDLRHWTEAIRKFSKGKTKVWVQVGTVAGAIECARLCSPDVLVVQGSDAGGHGLVQGAGVISLFPEVADALEGEGFRDISLVAAGGIAEGRGVAACLSLGAEGVVMGTRFLASPEATIAKGYQDDVLRSKDGGISTVRTSLYDQLRRTTGWPARFNARAIINESFRDSSEGKTFDEIDRLYKESLRKGDDGWGEGGRLAAYAGSAVGLVTHIMPAKEIVLLVREQARMILSRTSQKFEHT